MTVGRPLWWPSRRRPAGRLFSGLRAVVVDEVHAFAGDDRGWHLLTRGSTLVETSIASNDSGVVSRMSGRSRRIRCRAGWSSRCCPGPGARWGCSSGDFLHIGSEAERRFGRRYCSDLTAVFSAAPEFLVLAGRVEVGTVGTDLLVEEVEGPRVLLLAGRSWKVTHIDWQRRRCFVEPADSGGRAKWSGTGMGVSFEIARGVRTVLLGSDPEGATSTRRAATVLAEQRASYADVVNADKFVLALPSEGVGRWWTWAGTAANRTLQASLPGLVDPRQRINEQSLRLLPGVSVHEVSRAVASAVLRPPEVSPNAVAGLKFSAALPSTLAEATLGARLGDQEHARLVIAEQRMTVRQ